MRRIETRSSFRRDFRRELKGIYHSVLLEGGEFDAVKNALMTNIRLPEQYRDHALHGDWEGSRECHLRPNLLLVYTLADDNLLFLERLGSHAEIFGI